MEKKIRTHASIFVMFAFIAILIVLSPLVIKIPGVKDFVSSSLIELGSYKAVYITMIGGMVGTGLAVSSAIWMQQRDEKKRKSEKKEADKKLLELRKKRIERYLNRERLRLWNLWLWAKFESSDFVYGEKKYPFEPYCIDSSKSLDEFTEIEHMLKDSNIETFYELYYFAEKINSLIGVYNSIRKEQPHINGNFNNAYGNSLTTEYKNTASTHNLINAIKDLIEMKTELLFTNNEKEMDSTMDHMIYVYNLRSKRSSITKRLVDKLYESKEEVESETSYLIRYAEEKEVEEWLETMNLDEIPKQFHNDIEEIKKIEEKINRKEDDFSSKVKSYSKDIDTPSCSKRIEELYKDLKV